MLLADTAPSRPAEIGQDLPVETATIGRKQSFASDHPPALYKLRPNREERRSLS